MSDLNPLNPTASISREHRYELDHPVWSWQQVLPRVPREDTTPRITAKKWEKYSYPSLGCVAN